MIIKICGITHERDAEVAIDAGATAVGLNFYRSSPRFVTFEQARHISRLPGKHLRVGIFVNAEPDELVRAVEEAALDLVQLHGAFRRTHLRTWRALRAGEPVPENDGSVEAYLLDSAGTDPAKPAIGGSGRTFDWSIAARFPHRKIVAGGLDEWNVADAIEASAPWGVDACSRLEASPGIKDAKRVRAFVKAARTALSRETAQEVYL